MTKHWPFGAPGPTGPTGETGPSESAAAKASREQRIANQKRQAELGHRFGHGKMASKVKSRPRAR